VPRIALADDARACLERLAGRAAVAGISDGPPESQRAKVEALQLSRWLTPIVFTAELGLGYGKPHPRAFEIVAAACGVRADECAYVADNPAKDFAGPASLGWRTVRVRRPGGLHSAVPSGNDVSGEVEDLRTLHEVLGMLA
jgi:putative hydrolase of the HAD superfamily